MRVMSRISLLLVVVLATVGIGVPIRLLGSGEHSTVLAAHPAAAASPAPVVVTVTVSPSPSSVASLTTISAVTVANALCQIQVLLPGGGSEQSPGLTEKGADNNGNISWQYLPSGAAQGTDTAIVTCSALPYNVSGQGSASFIVLPQLVTPSPTGSPIATAIPGVAQVVIVGPNPILPGGTFSLTGSGFTPGAMVSFTAFTNLQSFSATVSISGTFTIANITVPYTQTPGPVILSLRDNANIPDVVPVTLVVAPPSPAITVNTTTAAHGDPVQVVGTGYGANEVVQVSLGPVVLLTTKADNTGKFIGVFNVPNTIPFGTYNVSAAGQSTGALNFTALTVTPNSPFAPTATATGTATNTATPLPPTPTATITPVPQGPNQATYYLAEGSTAPGSIENLNVLDTASIGANIDLMLVFEDGVVKTAHFLVPARALYVINVNGLVGNEVGRAVSIKVFADQQVSVARSIERPGHDGTLSDGTAAITHYIFFAEGYTGRAFHETLALFNSVNANANVVLKLLPSNGKPAIVKNFIIGPIRRYTVDVNKLAPNQSVGAEIISDVELAVERTLTFGKNGTGITTVPGVDTPQTTWYFAEGSTKNRFSEFITLLNPGTTGRATVTARFYDTRGRQIGSVSRQVVAGARSTINVGQYLSATSVGAVVSSSVPILAERSMYRGDLQGKSVIGATSFGRALPASGFEFPSGDTSPGNAEFLLLLNPNASPLTVVATFYSLAGTPVSYTALVPAHSRVTVDVARDVPLLPRGLHGVALRSLDGSSFLAEQSLYRNNFSSASTTLGVTRAPTPVLPAS